MDLRPSPRAILIGTIATVACALILWIGFAVWSSRREVLQLNCHGRMYELATEAVEHYLTRRAFPAMNDDPANDGLPGWRSHTPGYDAETWTCPSGDAAYRVVSGPGTIFDGEKVAAADVIDGVANTILFVELTRDERARVQSAQIVVADLETLLAPGEALLPASIHHGGRGILFADSVIYRQVKPISIAVLRALATRNGGEPVTRQQLVDGGYIRHLSRRPEIPEILEKAASKR